MENEDLKNLKDNNPILNNESKTEEESDCGHDFWHDNYSGHFICKYCGAIKEE